MEINMLLELTAYAKPYRVDAMNSLEWIELDQKLDLNVIFIMNTKKPKNVYITES